MLNADETHDTHDPIDPTVLTMLKTEDRVDRIIDSLRGEGGEKFKSLMASLGPQWHVDQLAECENLQLGESASEEVRTIAERVHVKIMQARQLLRT